MTQFRLKDLRLLAISSLLLALTACGVENSDYTPTRDSITLKVAASFDVSAQTISVASAEDVTSTILSPCVLGVETRVLAYELLDTNTLLLNGNRYARKSGLNPAESLDGVPDGVFAVWSAESQVYDQVTNQIDIEIHPESLTYRNNCSR